MRSWQIILSDQELNSKINIEESRDQDFASGESMVIAGDSFDRLIDSSSSHVFKNAHGVAEVLVTEVGVEVYLTEAAAGQTMKREYATHFEAYMETKVEKNKLKRYTSPDGPDTKIDVNPFYSSEVPIRPFGDESFCYKWSAFAPTVVYRVTNTIVTVTARIVVPARNLTYHDAATFEHTLDVAKHQEAKLRSLMGSAVFRLPGQKTEAESKLLADVHAKAQKGDAQSQYELARAFEDGSLGLAKDDGEAVKWYRKAAEQNYAQAQSNLGAFYGLGRGVAKDEAEAVRWYRKAAEQNYAKAQFNLGACYGLGEGVVKDYVEAVKWFRRAADQNLAEAQYSLGSYYASGKGVAEDEAEAVKWYRKAAEQNFALAQNKLAGCYYKGEGVVKDYVEAVRWYRKAAEQNNAKAQSNLGACYGFGRGVAKDYVEAVKWFGKAAAQNLVEAQYNLGSSYWLGEGVTKDDVEAVKWFRKAAEQNYPSAQFSLGVCYQEGQGVAKDDVTAVKWYRKAAEQNDASAQCGLGGCYILGEGVAKDYVEAYKWKLLASDQGDEDARKSVTLLEDRMTREQIAEGQKLARNFKPREVPASEGRDNSVERPATE
jgi:TPR repeat protein